MYTNISTYRESAKGTEFVPVQDELFSSRKIFLNESITADSVFGTLMQLQCLEKLSTEEPIELWLNSPGGSVYDGLVLYDYLRGMKTPVTIIVAGIAASMGAIILLGADKRLCMPHSKIMIHDPSTSTGGGYEKPSSLSEKLDTLLKIRDSLNGIITERTGISPDEVEKLTSKDCWFNAEEALANKFITGIYPEKV